MDHPLGPTTLNATFRGNISLFLEPSYQILVLDILASTSIILHNTPTLLAPEDTLSFSITLLDDMSTPLAGRSVFIYNDGVLIASALTNTTGGAFFSIHCNSTWIELGDNAIQVIHEQDIENYYERTESLFIVEIQQIQTSLDSSFSYDSILLGSIVDFSIELDSIVGGISTNLEVRLDESYLTTISTNDSGVGTINLAVDERFSLGSHSFTIVYNGNERYTESFTTIPFDVVSPILVEINTPVTAVIGLYSNLDISLCDVLERPIVGSLYVSDLSSGINTSILIPYDTTNFNVLLLILGPVGSHNIQLEIVNPYVINSSTSYDLDVWSQPELLLQHSNVLHYASPNQSLSFIFQLTDWSGNISSQPLYLLIDNQLESSFTTNENGVALVFFSAPNDEGAYNLSIVYLENVTRFELSVRHDYHLTVSVSIPVKVELDYYEVVPPLQKIIIHLHTQCMNGSLIKGIKLNIIWESINTHVSTQQGGILELHLRVPDSSGNYTLSYEIEATNNLAASAGTIEIQISLEDVLASQGIGINGFALGIITSFVVIAIPLLRQKFLMV